MQPRDASSHTPPRTPLHGLIEAALNRRAHATDPDVVRLLQEIHRRHGDHVAAVLLYGSYLRGKRDTLLDFYVLLDDFAGALPRLQALGNRLLPPNVYYLALSEETGGGHGAVRAKYATMTVQQFERGMSDFHGYFWSRFTQPVGMVQTRDAATAARVVDAVAQAVETFVSRTAPMLEAPFSAKALWQSGLALTYASELRAESEQGIDSVYQHDADHFDAVLRACVESGSDVIVADESGRYRPRAGRSRAPFGATRPGWALRRVQGKGLSVLRLVKAAATFDDPLDYLLWKIERHSGIYLEPTARQRRHPLLFAWPLLWRLYRRGAFR